MLSLLMLLFVFVQINGNAQTTYTWNGTWDVVPPATMTGNVSIIVSSDPPAVLSSGTYAGATSLTVIGNIELSGGSISTTNGIIFNDTVSNTAAITISTTNGDVRFNSFVSSTANLTISTTNGDVGFNSSVNSTADLTITSNNISASDSIISSGTLTFTSRQNIVTTGAGYIQSNILNLNLTDASDGNIGTVTYGVDAMGNPTSTITPLKINTAILNASTYTGLDVNGNSKGNILVNNQGTNLTLGTITTNGNSAARDETNDKANVVIYSRGMINTTNPIDAWSVDINAELDVNIATKTENINVNILNTGNIAINNTSPLLKLFNVKARLDSAEAMTDANTGDVIVNHIVGNTVQTEIGTQNISINTTGILGIAGDVSAPNEVSITTTGGNIYHVSNSSIISNKLELNATGDIGQNTLPIKSSTGNSIKMVSTNGDVWFEESNKCIIDEISANGQVWVQADVRDVYFPAATSVISGDKVTITVLQGNIRTADSHTLITADTLILTVKTYIGTTVNPILTAVADYLSTETQDTSANTFITNTGNLKDLLCSTVNGDVTINSTSPQLSFTKSNSILSLTNGTNTNFSFTNKAGNIVSNGVTLGNKNLYLNAAALISQNSGTIVAGNATLIAGSNIASQVSPIISSVDSLSLLSDAGNIFVSNDKALKLLAESKGSSGNIEVNQTGTGDLTLYTVKTKGNVTLTSSNSIIAMPLSNATDVNISAQNISMDAGNSIGASNVLTEESTGNQTISATGYINVSNTGNLAALDITSNAAGNIEFSNDGNVMLNTAVATGHTVTLNLTGVLSDGNGNPATNITSDSLYITAFTIGGSDAIETAVKSYNNIVSHGAVSLENSNNVPLYILQITAMGEVNIVTNTDIYESNISAAGQNVIITTDNNHDIYDYPQDNTDINIKASSFEVSCRNLGTESDPLEYNVNMINSHASGTTFAENATPLTLTAAQLANGGTFTASSIYIEDNGGNNITVNGNLNLKAIAGNIVFLNPADNIQTNGNVVFDATGCSLPVDETGPVGNIIVGNITAPNNKDITLKACHHIGINQLQGRKVTIQANNGFIVDMNAAAVNIIADSADLYAKGHNNDDLVLESAEANANVGDKNVIHNQLYQSLSDYSSLNTTWGDQAVQQKSNLDALKAQVASKYAEVRSLASEVSRLWGIVTSKDVTFKALSLAIKAVKIAGGAAQAIPLTGDGGAMGLCEAAELALSAADLAFTAASIAHSIKQSELGETRDEYGIMASNLYTLQNQYNTAFSQWVAINKLMNEYVDLYARSGAALNAAHKLQSLYTEAYQQHNPIGAAANGTPLAVNINQNINATITQNGNINLYSANQLPLGLISAATTGTHNDIFIGSNDNILLSNTVSTYGTTLLNAPNGYIDNNTTGNPLISQCDTLILRTLLGTGTSNVNPMNIANIQNLAVDNASGNVYVTQTGTTPLTIGHLSVNANQFSGTVEGIDAPTSTEVFLTTGDDLILNEQIKAPTANATVIINSGNRIITTNYIAPQIITSSLDITYNHAIASVTVPLAVNVEEINIDYGVSGGDIYLNEINDITVKNINAGTTNDVYFVAGGAIYNDCVNTTFITAKTLMVSAQNGIGMTKCASCEDDALETAVDTLDAVTINGNIAIDNGGAVLNVLNAVAQNGRIYLRGNIVSLQNTHADDILELNMTSTNDLPAQPQPLTASLLRISKAAGNIGSLSNPFLINVDTLEVNITGTGNLFLEETSGNLVLGAVQEACFSTPVNSISTQQGNITITIPDNLWIIKPMVTPDNVVLNAQNGEIVGFNPANDVSAQKLTVNASNTIQLLTVIDSVTASVVSTGDINIDNTGNLVIVDNYHTQAGHLYTSASGNIEVYAPLTLTDSSAFTAVNTTFKSNMNMQRNKLLVTGNATFTNSAVWIADVIERNSAQRNWMEVTGDVYLSPRFMINARQFADNHYDIVKVGGDVYDNVPSIIADNAMIDRSLIRCYGYNTYNIFDGIERWIRIKSIHVCDSVVDYDGNVYASVGVGSKCWLQRNLTSEHYSDGTPVSSYIYYSKTFYFDSLGNLAKFGRLYDFATTTRNATDFTVDVQGICPNGWRLPTNEDALELKNYGADGVRANAYWLNGGLDTMNFIALPAGYYNYSAERYFGLMGDFYFWIGSSMELSNGKACHICFSCPIILFEDMYNKNGLSVRCVKTNTVEP
jgi:uncharacterized protein (TIGR02145 family)